MSKRSINKRFENASSEVPCITEDHVNGMQVYLHLPKSINQNHVQIVWVLDGGQFFQEIEKIISPDGCKNMVIVGIDSHNRLDDYTPWPAEALTPKFDPFGGNGRVYLDKMITGIVPWLMESHGLIADSNNTYLMGYSLGGLLSLYSLFHTAFFAGIASVSGSFWYPGLLKFIQNTRLLNTDAKIYLGCGESEGASSKDIKKTMVANTAEIADILRERLGIHSVTLEWDGGGHHDHICQRYRQALRAIQTMYPFQ